MYSPGPDKKANKRRIMCYARSVSELHACLVSYRDVDGIQHSVEVTAESLYEAAVMGMTALKVEGWQNLPSLEIEVRVRLPETRHTIWNSVLAAWLARPGKTPREQALKSRLRKVAI